MKRKSRWLHSLYFHSYLRPCTIQKPLSLVRILSFYKILELLFPHVWEGVLSHKAERQTLTDPEVQKWACFMKNMRTLSVQETVKDRNRAEGLGSRSVPPKNSILWNPLSYNLLESRCFQLLFLRYWWLLENQQ